MRLLKIIEDAFAGITYIALFSMMLLITFDAVGRYVLRANLPDIFHLTELFLMPLVICCALARAQREKAHVNVTLLSQFFSPRVNSSLAFLVYTTSGLICAVITYMSFASAWPHIVNWRVTGGVVPWPTGISRAIIPLGFSLLSIRLLVDGALEFRTALKGEPYLPPPSGPSKPHQENPS